MATSDVSPAEAYVTYRNAYTLCAATAFVALCGVLYFGNNALNGIAQEMYISVHGILAVAAVLILSIAVAGAILNGLTLRHLGHQDGPPQE